MTSYQQKRLKALFYQVNDAEQNDIKQAAKALKPHIIRLMHEAYLMGWLDSGAKADEMMAINNG